MPRLSRFTFVVNDEERKLIQVLAEKLQRSQSDALRFIVLSATRELESDNMHPSQQLTPATEGGKNA